MPDDRLFAVRCLICVPGRKTLIGHYPQGEQSAAAHDHIDRAHPTDERGK